MKQLRISDEGQPGRWIADAQARLVRLNITAEVTHQPSPHGYGRVVIDFFSQEDCAAFAAKCAGGNRGLS